MTTIDSINASVPPQPPVPAPPASRSAGPGRVVAIILGALIAVAGLLTAISGVVLLAIFGGGHAVATGDHVVSTPTSALVADIGHIGDIRGFEPLTGSPTLHVTAQNVGDRGVFVGVGRTADVERYLDGVAVDRIADLDLAPFRFDTVRDEGSTVAGAPGEQDFWVASDQSGPDFQAVADLQWAIEGGDYEIVVMNADGSGSVVTNASIGTSLPTSTGLWIVVIVTGGLFLAGGTALIVVGARRGR